MALKTDRIHVDSQIDFFMNEVAERGGIACISTAGSGAAMVDAFASLNVVDLKVEDDLTVTDDAAIGGLATVGGTLGVTGVVTANAGVVVDEMTIDGDTLTATDEFIVDAASHIKLDADSGNIIFRDAGTNFSKIINSSGDVLFSVEQQDKDIKFNGNDGGGAITALVLDMSAAGAATFNDKIIATELDISGDVDIDGTLETDALSIASTTITSTAAELNFSDGVTSNIQTQLNTKTSTGKAIAMAIVFG